MGTAGTVPADVYTFISQGLRCTAEPVDEGWRVCVVGVTVATSPDLASAIGEATGGLVGAETASVVASGLTRARLAS